jgi:hypothetical protein
MHVQIRCQDPVMCTMSLRVHKEAEVHCCAALFRTLCFCHVSARYTVSSGEFCSPSDRPSDHQDDVQSRSGAMTDVK